MYLLGSILEKLKAFDEWLFLLINNQSANPFFDVVMPFMRQPLHWAPLYLFIFVFAAINFRVKGLWWIVFFLSTVALPI